MNEVMTFPKTVEEFMEQHKIVDTEQIYTNGIELVPIFRMKQWFDHLPYADVVEVVRCKDCKYLEKLVGMVEGEPVTTMHLCRRYPVSVETTPYGFCDRGERRV